MKEPASKIDLKATHRALFLDRSDGTCGDLHCRYLRDALERSNLFTDILDRASAVTIAAVPDIIVVRAAGVADGQKLLNECRMRWNRAPIVLILCRNAVHGIGDLHAVLALADEFLFCSAIEPELGLRSRRLLLLRRLKLADNIERRSESVASLPLVGSSPSFIGALRQAASVAGSDATVLISGETGSGKELVARAIHYQGRRRAKPFIPINCGALPDHLFENELFGHNKGAFTDASSTELGLVAEADRGTLFLDEVDTLSPAAQVKLLRFLQDGEYRPLGSSRSIHADVRVIAATNCDLKDKVQRKEFREDLFYRLNILSVALPPLRERGTDVLHLAEHFLDQYGNGGGAGRLNLSEAARQKLLGYSWPGNVRELQAVMQRAALLRRAGMLHAADIELSEGKSKEILRHESLRRAKSFIVSEFERSFLANLLKQHQGNITQAAKAAGKDRRTLQRLVRKYCLDRQSFKA
jgi:two-component system, NtrC family, response regulator GlrR